MAYVTDYLRRISWLSALLSALLILAMAVSVTACGVVALPFRATSAVVKVVPVAGDVVAAPLDVTADAID